MELTIEEVKQLNERSEIKRFYHVLAIQHTNSIMRVYNQGEISVEAIIQRAIEQTDRLIRFDDEGDNEPTQSKTAHDKCKPPQIWDTALGRCIDP